VVTAVVAHRERSDGSEVVVQEPQRHEEAMASWNAPIQASDDQRAAARPRLLAWLHDRTPRLADKKRTESAVEIVQQLDQEGDVPQANSACENG